MAKNKKTAWHPAFVQAIQADLAAYHDILEFTPELPLTTEPLRVDLEKERITKIASPIFVRSTAFRENKRHRYRQWDSALFQEG
jgi:hypothetical protein